MKLFFFSLFSFCFLCFPLVVFGASGVLDVPFTSQAPEGNWDQPWQDACEEASLVMVDAFYTKTTFDVNGAKEKILSVWNTKNKAFGESFDESPQKMVRMIENQFQWDAFVSTNTSFEAIEREIKAGHPVIVPFDARRVENPNFRSPKPDYHVAVIIGIDEEKNAFVVHDPGTSLGANFFYGVEDLLEANQKYTIGDTGAISGGEMIFTRPRPEPSLRLELLLERFKLFWLFMVSGL